ncbi:MAG: hypothetical protein Q8P44_05575, partial [Dehalococcoidia bacterium]|nr:hypothetical protein [Dehalococcoidia bacterium]
MPKLSQATLEKRFQCGYCAKTLRSRQGLSGHIQFKHMDFFKPLKKVKRVDKKDDMGFFTSK